MTQPVDALLVRHAETSGQAHDAPLTKAGLLQAQLLAGTLARLGAGPLFTSPMRRARDTIAPFAEASGLEVSVLNDLREFVLSPEPLDDWRLHVERTFEDPRYKVPGGESQEDACSRAAAALREISSGGGSRPAFVTHGRLTAALFNACDPTFGFREWGMLRNPDVFAVQIVDGAIGSFERLEFETQAPD